MIIRKDTVLIAAARLEKVAAQRDRLIAQVNEAVGEVRARFITPIPGQEIIYSAKEAEAVRYFAQAPETLDEFPFIAAEVGLLADTPYEVAQIWLGMGHYWRQVAAALEQLRMSTTAAIEAASTTQELEAVMETFHEQLEGLL